MSISQNKDRKKVNNGQTWIVLKWSFFLAIIVALIIGFLLYKNYMDHRCDNLCVTMFNNRNVPVLFEFGTTRVLVGAGTNDGTFISQLGKRLPFYTKSLDMFIQLDTSTSSVIATNDLLQKYSFENIATSSDSVSFIVDKFSVTWKSFQTKGSRKGITFKPKHVLEVDVLESRFIFDIDTTLSQKDIGWGSDASTSSIGMVFLKNFPITPKQEEHIQNFLIRTPAEIFVVTSASSSAKVSKNKRLLDLLGGKSVLFPLDSHNSITCRIKKDLTEQKQNRFECG